MLKHGKEPNGTGGILRITQEGQAIGNGILAKGYPLNLYFAFRRNPLSESILIP